MLDILRCLTCGESLTEADGEVTCSCGAVYPRIDGVVVLNKDSNYYGEVKAGTKEEIIERMQAGEHWSEVVWDKFRYSYSFLHHIIVDETRNDFSTLLPVTKESTVLDLGAGWGTTSCHFAKLAKRVISLDGTFDRTRFIQNRIQQDGVDNIHTVCVNILDKPFADDSFDVVLLNGVLEWVGTSLPDLEPREAQLATLKEVRRILKPGGALYIGIENSHGYRYILGGMDDHTALYHVGYHTREKANEVRFKHQKKRYDTYTYDMSGYSKLLEEAGFDLKDFYYPYPDYKWVNSLFPLDDPRPLSYYYDNVHENQDADTEVERTRSLELHGLEHGHVKHHVASYSIIASSGEVGGYAPALKQYVAANSEKLFGMATEAKDVTFLQLSGAGGKKYDKGRLKHMLFAGADEPRWVAITTRDPKSSATLTNEYGVLSQQSLKKAESFIVPEAFIADNIFGRTALFQRRLDGKSMTQRMADMRYRMGFEPQELYDMAAANLAKGAGVLAELQAIPAAELGGTDETAERFATVRAFCEANGLDTACVDFMEARVADAPVVLAHGDFVPWNLLENGECSVGLIDWELAYCGKLGVMDWLRFAWGTIYDLARLKADENSWEEMLEAVLVKGDHPVSASVDSFLTQHVGCGVGSEELKALMRYFFVNEALLQIEHSRDVKSSIIENAKKYYDMFN